jgi:peptidoglycan/xylan/chitin deacetylase (PgdA/CDA1 family)
VILWSADPGDVIILHDGGRRGRRTEKVLAGVLPELKRNGYRVVTLSELVEIGGKTIPSESRDGGG